MGQFSGVSGRRVLRLGCWPKSGSNLGPTWTKSGKDRPQQLLVAY